MPTLETCCYCSAIAGLVAIVLKLIQSRRAPAGKPRGEKDEFQSPEVRDRQP